MSALGQGWKSIIAVSACKQTVNSTLAFCTQAYFFVRLHSDIISTGCHKYVIHAMVCVGIQSHTFVYLWCRLYFLWTCWYKQDFWRKLLAKVCRCSHLVPRDDARAIIWRTKKERGRLILSTLGNLYWRAFLTGSEVLLFSYSSLCFMVLRLELRTPPVSLSRKAWTKTLSLGIIILSTSALSSCQQLWIMNSYIGMPVRRFPGSGGLNSSARLSSSNWASIFCSKPSSVLVIIS